MDVLERLKQLQKEYAWSDYKLAQKAGLSQGTVSNIYKRNTIPNIYTLDALCKAFGLTLAQFFADNSMMEITPEQKELFDCWIKLSEEKQKSLMQLMKWLI